MGSSLVVALFGSLVAAVCSGRAGRTNDTGSSLATSTSWPTATLSNTMLKTATIGKVTRILGKATAAGKTFARLTTSSAGGDQPKLAGIPIWCWIAPTVVLATLLFAVVLFTTLLFLLIGKRKSEKNEANEEIREVKRKLGKVVEERRTTVDKLKSAEEERDFLADRLDRVEYDAAVRLYQLHQLHQRYMVRLGYWCADDPTQCQHEHKEECSDGDADLAKTNAPQQLLKDRLSKARHPVFQKCADEDPESVFDELVADTDPDRVSSFRAERDTPKPPTPKRRNRRLERQQSTEGTSDTKGT